jgi:hypothetical protein
MTPSLTTPNDIPPHAACGLNSIHAMVILGSMVQTHGPAHGTYFDPADLRPLFTSPAMHEALRLLKELRRYR